MKMSKNYPLSQLFLLLSLLVLAESLTLYDLNYPDRLRQLCDNNNLTYF